MRAANYEINIYLKQSRLRLGLAGNKEAGNKEAGNKEAGSNEAGNNHHTNRSKSA
jgi:hypothetical protein